MGTQGLLSLGVPEEYGGSGEGIVPVVAAMEAMAANGIPIALVPAHRVLPRGHPAPRLRRAEAALRRADGRRASEKICFAITEPNAGTNSFKMEVVAVRQDDGTYRLNGSKIFISGADAADRMLVVARTTRAGEVADRRAGMSLFVLDTKQKGVELVPQDIDILIADLQHTVFFDDVVVTPDQLIGEEGQGFRYMFDALNPERVLTAAWACGIGDYALAKGVEYACERAPFGAPIGSYQGLQHPLARSPRPTSTPPG